MRKLILSAIALGFLTIACKKEETTKPTPTTPTQTIGDFIKNQAGWRVDSVYLTNLTNGSRQATFPIHCMRDDKFVFGNNNKGMVWDMQIKCDPESPDTTSFNYRIFSNNDSIGMSFFGLEELTSKIYKVDNNRFATITKFDNTLETTIYKKY